MADARSTLVKLGDYEVGLLIEGKEVEHYQIQVDEEKKTASCWVASEVGKRFGIRARKTHTLFDCAALYTLDGHRCGGNLFSKANKAYYVKDSVILGASEAKLFTFGALTVTDDESLVQDPDSVKNIGEIKVQIKRCTRDQREIIYCSVPKPQAVHERAKKAAPHRVQYGDKVAFTDNVISCTYYETHATLVIRYTSLEMLQAMGIAPRPEPTPPADSPQPERSSSASTSRSKRKADEVKTEDQNSDEELDPEERQREAELQAELERLRQTRESRRAQKRVKTEVFAPVFTPGEVIDLT